jgi:L-aspartate oxidase
MRIESEILHTDYLIVGGGIAGIRAAIELARAGSVILLTKEGPTDSNTEVAQGGIAVALGDEDEVSLHAEDTLRAGDGLCDPAAVKILVGEGVERISELIDWGTAFDREGSLLSFTREAAHSRSRVVHARGDSTGREVMRVLRLKAATHENIRFLHHCFCMNLVVQDGAVWGASFLDEREQAVRMVRARVTILASGGAGRVFAETTNPELATGDGIAIALRAGAIMSDLEFFQFHPTALHLKGAPRFLLSEAIRGEGGYLRNVDCDRFMPRYHYLAELAPRDIVSRAIVVEMKKTGSSFVYLDLTHLSAEFIRKRFPRIYETCLNYNIDITVDMIPVHPAAHYFMGGVKTDLEGRTSLRNLYAAGEVACTGVHGANRLASNSLLEGLVFGARVGRFAVDSAPVEFPADLSFQVSAGEFQPLDSRFVRDTWNSVQKLMWEKAGIMRNGHDMKEALRHLLHWDSKVQRLAFARPDRELANLLVLSELIILCAMAREESRGAHYRTEFPCRNDQKFQKHSLITSDRHVRFMASAPLPAAKLSS